MRRRTGQLTAVAAALALAAFGLVACGSDSGSGSGSDEDKIKDVLTTAVETNDGSICTDLFTTNLVEELTGETGDDGIKACEEDAESGDVSENVSVENIEIDGDSATADVSFETDGEEEGFGAELVKDGDDWKIDGIN